MTVPLTAQLELVGRWATELGNKVSQTEATNPAGQSVPALQVQHGVVTLLVVDQSGTVAVLSIIQFPPEARKITRQLSNDVQERLLNIMRNAMMDNPRTGWTITPPTATRAGDVEVIQLVQLLRIDEQGTQSFNRLADALQELATMTIKVGSFYGGALRPGATPQLPALRPRDGDDRIYR